MEKAKQDAFDNARLQVIKDGYERAFECINKGLSADEVGQKSQALEHYKQGRQHLLRAISVPSLGDECHGASWDSARQMQRKMQETLDNITTRLAMLETTSEVDPAPGAAAGALYPKLPNRNVPEHPPPPNVLSAKAEEVVQAGQPPAYSPQAADGHLSISYGTESGEMLAVGDEFYSRTSNSTPSPQSEDGEELLYIQQGVQIFFVTPDGQVSAPSYPSYLRLVKFTNDHPDSMPNRPPAFLQVGSPSDARTRNSCPLSPR